MNHVRALADSLRSRYPASLDANNLPIDVLVFAEVDLELNPVPFAGLLQHYRIDAAIDFENSTLYLDKDQYLEIDKRPWIARRFRFSVAHELGHYFLHKELVSPFNYADLHAYKDWCRNYGGNRYTYEQEANEFAGLILVPTDRLNAEMTAVLSKYQMVYGWSGLPPPEARTLFCDTMADKFQVSPAVISIRLDRDGLWPAE